MAISNNEQQGASSSPGEMSNDERIRKEVCDRMDANGHLNARSISVRVEDGEVWLRGAVESERQRLLAINIADAVPGVVNVHSHLGIMGLEGRRNWAEASAQAMQQQQGIDWRPRLRAGMLVIGTDGDKIGRVKEVWDNDFRVARRMARDVYIPMLSIENIKNDTVMLNIPAHRAGAVAAKSPPPGESPDAGNAGKE